MAHYLVFKNESILSVCRGYLLEKHVKLTPDYSEGHVACSIINKATSVMYAMKVQVERHILSGSVVEYMFSTCEVLSLICSIPPKKEASIYGLGI